MNLELFLESTSPANVYVGEEDADGNTGWLLPLSAWTTDQHDGMLSPHTPALSPEQLTVWSAQLRMVAQQLDDLTEGMQPQICFPTTGREGSN